MKYKTSIFHLFRPRSEAHATALSRAGASDGADGICFELASLPPEERTVDVFRRIIAATPLPKIFCTYRNDMYLGGDDEARMTCLLKAAEAGADYVDVMGDLYDASPGQLTRSPSAVARQREVIAAIHACGAKAIVSSHVPDLALGCAEMLEHLREQARHGADVCKLVSFMPTANDFVESVRAMEILRTTFERPWILLGSGTFGRLQRFTGPAFGCSVEFAVHDYDPEEDYPQPTIRELREGLSALAWEAPSPQS